MNIKAQSTQYKSLSFYYADKIKPYDVDGDSLFSEKNSEKYINWLFKTERKNRKIKKCLDLITPFRARHTVSAYLLGLTIRDEIRLNTRDWRRLPNEKSSAGSFRLFWSWVCVFHDIGYYYETNGSKYSNCLTVEELIKKLKILQFQCLTLCNSANGGKALIFRRFRHLPFGRVLCISRRIPA